MTTDYLYIGYINHLFAKKKKNRPFLVLKVHNIPIYQLLYRAKNPTLLKTIEYTFLQKIHVSHLPKRSGIFNSLIKGTNAV